MSLLARIAGIFIRELLVAVASYLRDRRRDADLKALGRAEAERTAAIEAALRRDAMDGVPLPEDADVIERLRKGLG